MTWKKSNASLFSGTDMDGDKKVGREEMLKLVTAFSTNDQLYINKLLFRAAFEDGDGKIGAAKFVASAGTNGIRGMAIEKAEKQIIKLSNGRSYLTFPRMQNALTGQDVPENQADPYDGYHK